MNRLQELQQLQQLQVQILLEDCQQQLRELLKGATVEVVDGGFVVHGYKSSSKAKPEDCWVPNSVTLAGEAFWVAHPCCDNALRFVGEWLLTAEGIPLNCDPTLNEPVQLSLSFFPGGDRT